MNSETISNMPGSGLDLLTTGVMLVDRSLTLRYANPAAESLFGFSAKSALAQPLARVFAASGGGSAGLTALLDQVFQTKAGFNDNDLVLESAGLSVHVSCSASPLDEDHVLLEFHALDQQLKIAREENLLEHQRLNRELIRNLAHEIKNPLGGIRGAAQLLEHELADASLSEYTQVIILEADRLQALMDRLLTPHRVPTIESLNIHEVLERVRAIVLAEFPLSIHFVRDYDTSLPELQGDKEQLIQALLNVARNAAQAMAGHGQIKLVTRIARQVTLAKQRYRHAIEVQVVDNGPGVPATLRDQIFYPLVSGRDGGTGLGLSLAQSLVNQHAGVIEFESEPGSTRFIVLLPVRENALTGVVTPLLGRSSA